MRDKSAWHINKAFVLIEVLIAGLILSLCVGASMYLFSLGFQHLNRSSETQLLLSKLPLAITYLKTVEDFEGERSLGDGVIMKWSIRPIHRSVTLGQDEQLREVRFVTTLCRAVIVLKSPSREEQREIFLIRHKSLQGK